MLSGLLPAVVFTLLLGAGVLRRDGEFSGAAALVLMPEVKFSQSRSPGNGELSVLLDGVRLELGGARNEGMSGVLSLVVPTIVRRRGTVTVRVRIGGTVGPKSGCNVVIAGRGFATSKFVRRVDGAVVTAALPVVSGQDVLGLSVLAFCRRGPADGQVLLDIDSIDMAFSATK